MISRVNSTPVLYNVRDKLSPAPIHPCWADVPAEKWNSWAWQQQNRLTTLEALMRIIEISEEEREAFQQTENLFNFSVSPYYASLMNRNDPDCPIRKQAVPALAELYISPDDIEDPLNEEADMPVPGLTHRYPDRVLLYTIHNCAMYCRFCTRKRKVANPSSTSSREIIENAFRYIENHKEIRDVVISGGDPLSYADHKIEYFLARLRAIEHIEVFRIGTRNLVTLPQRVTDDFAKMVAKYHPVYIHTHFNHPAECTREAFDACEKLANAGCVLHNQTVLLKGINDNPETIKALNHRLLMMRVRPYYLFQCDLSEGLSHFRTPIEKGIEIIESLRGWTSGMAVPHFVVDLPGGGGKVPLIPDYVVEHQDKDWTFRNFRNQHYKYREP
jgi:lysine 2,3-aminomutase